MKKFNLEEALAGKPVITRDGREVTQLTKFDVKEGDCLYGVVNGRVSSWEIDGQFYSGEEEEDDIFMKPEKKSIWVNVYNNGDNISIGHKYSTEKLALEASKNDPEYIKTIEITNEK